MLVDTTLLFDARLVCIDNTTDLVTVEAAGILYVRRLIFPAYWLPGTIGLLVLPADDETFEFQSYPDQRLRRAAKFDLPDQQAWGWVIEEHRFTVKRGILPGLSGAVVRDDCQPLELPIPAEFVDCCVILGLSPEQLLRSFIADACAIIDSRRRPREDRYCSSGAHERFLAREYCRRLRPASNTVPSLHAEHGAAVGNSRDA